MSTTLRTLLASTAIAVSLPVMAQAASVPSPIDVDEDTVTAEAIKQGLMEIGYNDITYVEGAGRYWTVRAYHDGRYMPLEIDAETGAVMQRGDPDLQVVKVTETTRADDIAVQLHQLGYSNVEVAPRQGNFTDATAWRYGEDVNLTIDMTTGVVTNHDQDMVEYVPMTHATGTDEVENALEQLGYSEVLEISANGNVYEGNAVRYGERVEFTVDRETGEIMTWKVDDQS